MLSAVFKYGSSLIYGQSDETERVPATDGEARRDSLVEKVDENWVIIGENVQESTEDISIPVREDLPKKHEKKRMRVTSSRRKLTEMQSSSKTNYSPYIKSESHFNHNKRSRRQKASRQHIAPITQPRQRSFK